MDGQIRKRRERSSLGLTLRGDLELVSDQEHLQRITRQGRPVFVCILFITRFFKRCRHPGSSALGTHLPQPLPSPALPSCTLSAHTHSSSLKGGRFEKRSLTAPALGG